MGGSRGRVWCTRGCANSEEKVSNHKNFSGRNSENMGGKRRCGCEERGGKLGEGRGGQETFSEGG